jgi:TRAP transporter 4TM/12TM fusion protein
VDIVSSITRTVIGQGRDGARETRLLDASIYALGIALSLFTLVYAYTFFMSRQRYSNVFLGLGLALFYLYEVKESVAGEQPAANEGTSPPWAVLLGRFKDWSDVHEALATRFGETYVTRFDNGLQVGFSVAAIACSVYVDLRWDYLQNSAQILGYSHLDYLVGTTVVLLVVDATRRAYGWPIAIVAIGSILYGLLGPVFPGILNHSGMSFLQVVEEVTVSLGGVYGFILGIGATWIAIFIIFAGVAKTFGLLDFVLTSSESISGRLRSGVVHIAVLSSLIIGSISGSAAANTATTGSFTIPMMKNQGVREDYAAAIESVASSGGQIMPPVMGVAAFLMADILGVPYVRVIQAGFVPAVLFYVSVALSVHLVTLKYGWTVRPSGTGRGFAVLKRGLHFLVPIGVLLYTLVVLQYSPMTAGLYSTAVLVGVMYVRNVVTDSDRLDSVGETTRTAMVGLKRGATDMAPLVGVLGSMGIIVSMVTQTGLSQRLSATMLTFGGDILVVLLLLAMVTSILFGLGMPTPAAYILVVILVAPALIEAGVPQLTAHMYVFYFAMLSSITPPVAIAVVIGARIADADFLSSALQALRIGAAGFIIPYGLVANESLIYWSFPQTAYSVIFLVTGLVFLSIGVVGYNARRRIGTPIRVVYVGFTFATLFAPFTIQLAAVGGGTVLSIANFFLPSTTLADT